MERFFQPGQPKKLSIIIPCYNEEKTIAELLRRVEASEVPGWEKEIIIVDDGSKDATRAILAGYEQKHTVLYQEKNGGKGTAVKAGIQRATGDYLLIQDADLEYDPAEYHLFTEAIDGKKANIIYGSRNLRHIERKGFLLSRLGVFLITKYMNLLYGISITDAWTCYKMFPRPASDLFVAGGFEAELLFTASVAAAGHTFFEVPISHAPRSIEDGKKIRYRDGFNSLWLMTLHRLSHVRARRAANRDVSSLPFVCPLCRTGLLQNESGSFCSIHGHFPVGNGGRPTFLPKETLASFEVQHHTGINWLKSFLKQFPRLYYFIWNLFCPVFMTVNGPKKIFRYLPQGSVVLNIGSGPERLGPEFINVDIYPFAEVDVIADAERLPFADGSIDAVVSESVFEHVEHPERMAAEAVRVVKPGGYVYISVPFIHPYHASPDDFSRVTTSGLKSMFAELEVVESGVRSGPWSAFLMFLAYWLGVIFSFGSRKAAPFLAHVFMVVLGPLKYLDLLFMFLPGAEAVACHVYLIGRKRR